jgi:integrase
LTAYALDPLKDARHRDAAAARELADWLQWLRLGNKAARTLDTYERVCAALLRAFPHKRFDEFTDGDILHVLAAYPERSRSTNKAALNGFFDWGYKTRRIPGNPVTMLPRISYRPDRAYDLFTPAEADALCALPSPDGHLLTIMFWSGIRRGECIGMTGKRLDLGHNQIVVIEGAKGSKTRKVPMIGRVAVAAAELLTLEGIGPNDYLWYSAPGGRVKRSKPISNARFDLWWNKALKAAGVRHRKPHTTRHSFATRMRELGLAMEEIQQLLGHESIRTTSDIYVSTNLGAIGDHMREVVGDLA